MFSAEIHINKLVENSLATEYDYPDPWLAWVPTIVNNIEGVLSTIILLGKLCISKLRYGQIKSIYLIFDLELNLRTRTLKHN